jgi:hypothetical protein
MPYALNLVHLGRDNCESHKQSAPHIIRALRYQEKKNVAHKLLNQMALLE